MSRVFLVFLAVLWHALAHPGGGARAEELVFEAFAPRPLTASEKRLLQTALAATGDYRGQLDGAWGSVSQGAIEAYAAREFADAALNIHAAALVLAFLEEAEANGWDLREDAELGISLALPLAALGPEQAEEGGRRWWSRAGSLTVLLHRFDDAGTAAWHDAALAANADPSALHTVRQPGLLV